MKFDQIRGMAHLRGVADAWLDSECNRPEGARQLSAVTMNKLAWLISLARPVLGTLQIGAVTEVDCVRAVEPIAKSGRVDTAHGVREVLSRVFNYAAVRGLRVGDPALALKRERSVLPKVESHAAIVEPKAFGGLLRAIEGYDSGVGNRARRTTTLALKLITLTALRPFELRHLRWSLVDIDNGRIELSAETIKMRKPHTVYLSRQAAEILTELRSINGHGELVFPAAHAKQVVRKDGPPVNRPTVRPISENTLNAALRRLGYGNADHVSHGFRTSMSTAANESGLFKSDIIEVTINHMDEDKVRAICNRARYEAERKRLSQWWADYCDALREDGHPVSGNVVPMVRT
jgi:integrase